VEIFRFGPGHRRLGGPPGTKNVEGAVIMHDDRAVVSELAFGRYAMVVPHENPDNTALFIVISGAGWVQVGDERARVNHGEAVVWPPNVPHGAYTDGTEMRAIVVELTGVQPALIEGIARSILREGTDSPDGSDSPESTDSTRMEPPPPPASPAQGKLAERELKRDDYDVHEGEPW
jgi:quercetin dioxygenase-like cupin family protein